MFIDLRSREIAKWRKKASALARHLSEWEENARSNDRTLRLLHEVAVLLIRKPKSWESALTELLKKRLSLLDCRLLRVESKDDKLRKFADGLAAGGRSADAALLPAARAGAAKSYFYLPIKKNRKAAAVLTLVSRRDNAFPPDAERDFVRRLSALIAAAL